jgi:glycosyltransferase involved in cell wall biosynthesis
MAHRVLSAIMFYPRGGSSHAARALARGLRDLGWSVTLLTGSRSDLGRHSDAVAFYGSENVRPVNFDAALRSRDPVRYEGPPGSVPMHPSFEDRPGAPDRVFAALDDLEYERQVRAWSRELARAGAADADVIHLHHLTPLNEAAARVAPAVPVVGQLHGTELLMLERIQEGPPPTWTHAERWALRMREWASRCAGLVVSPAGLVRAATVLELPAERLHPLPGGVDTDLFAPRVIDRPRFWEQTLVADPLAANPKRPGSLRYTAAEAAALAASVVLVYVGRFTAVKRLDRLIRAFSEARGESQPEASLVLVGGYPGESEAEHPAEIAVRLGARGVFLAGWHAQEELPDFFSASDAIVAASVREQFGQALIEGMACELPVVAPRSLGPSLIVDSGRTGWLADPRDPRALAAAMREAIEHQDERLRRGRAARLAVCERFSWSRVSGELAAVLSEVLAGARDAPAARA